MLPGMGAPLCFVLMPFGKKTDAAGKSIEFDEVYRQIIKPAIEAAGLAPVRADEELTRGMIHKPMFERLILCPFAVADLTTANANVFYELGVRHAVRPGSTVLLFAKGGRLPFDVAGLRSLPYELTDTGVPLDADGARAALITHLKKMRETPDADSPVFELLKPFPAVIEHLKTNRFQDQIEIADRLERELRAAKSADELKAVEAGLGSLDGVESAVIVKLFLSYRDVKAWREMIDFAEAMPKPLAKTVMIQEQLALALNRHGRSEDAERVLTNLVADRGGSSETYGILGRVYKDRWQKALKQEDELLAAGELEKAIDAYLKGFEADWRDAYPGVNAVTLMELKEPPDERRHDILPVVRYAASRRASTPQADYWDFATLMELAVLAKNEAEGKSMTAKAVAKVRAKWEPESTLNNLRMISDARRRRNDDEPAWIGEVMKALARAAQRL